MGDEPDYMSDEFLRSCIGSGNDERPGLIKSYREQRKHDGLKKKILSDKGKTTKKDDTANVVEGLQTPISSDNKGFLMLEKMGFKRGMGLGKRNSGIVEPIGINIKQDRRGFGEAEARERKKKQYKRLEEERKQRLTSVDEYVSMVSKKQKNREVACDLRKSRRICHQLDLRSEVKEPQEVWFWPEDSSESEEKKEEDEELELSEQLETLTKYLRKTYCYCIWCGVQYEDEKDLSACPGPERDLH